MQESALTESPVQVQILTPPGGSQGQMMPSFFFQKSSKNFTIVKYYAHMWNQHSKYIKMSTNMTIFGSVVLEIACDINIVMVNVNVSHRWMVMGFHIYIYEGCGLSSLTLHFSLLTFPKS